MQAIEKTITMIQYDAPTLLSLLAKEHNLKEETIMIQEVRYRKSKVDVPTMIEFIIIGEKNPSNN